MLGFPSALAPDAPSPDEFALQFWPEQKIVNAGLVLGLIRMLIGGPGGGNQVSIAISERRGNHADAFYSSRRWSQEALPAVWWNWLSLQTPQLV